MKLFEQLNNGWTDKRKAFYLYFALPFLSTSVKGLYFFIMGNLHNEIYSLIKTLDFKTFVAVLIAIVIFEFTQLPPGGQSPIASK